jgi:hypothetical protein
MTTAGLRQKCGREYDRAVLAHGSKAEAKLGDREKRIEGRNIRELDPTDHERYSMRLASSIFRLRLRQLT